MAYIGTQKVLDEKDIENGLISLTVKSEEVDELDTETEEMVLNKETYDRVKTKEPMDDATKLRDLMTQPVVEDLVLVLVKHNIRINDLEYIQQCIQQTLMQASLKKARKFYGNNEVKRTVHQYIEELYK